MEKSQENPSSLLQRVELAFEGPDPKVAERLKDQELWVQREESGRVHIRPPQGDKHMMLALNTQDSELYETFNESASHVAMKWQGFHQIGSRNRNGLTAWEIWRRPDISDEDILKRLKDEMLKEAATRIV